MVICILASFTSVFITSFHCFDSDLICLGFSTEILFFHYNVLWSLFNLPYQNLIIVRPYYSSDILVSETCFLLFVKNLWYHTTQYTMLRQLVPSDMMSI